MRVKNIRKQSNCWQTAQITRLDGDRGWGDERAKNQSIVKLYGPQAPRPLPAETVTPTVSLSVIA